MLQQSKELTDKWDTLIIYLVTSMLDPATKGKQNLKVIQEKAFTINQLFEFLKDANISTHVIRYT